MGVSDQVGKGREDWQLCPYLEELASSYYTLAVINLVGWAFLSFFNKQEKSGFSKGVNSML